MKLPRSGWLTATVLAGIALYAPDARAGKPISCDSISVEVRRACWTDDLTARKRLQALDKSCPGNAQLLALIGNYAEAAAQHDVMQNYHKATEWYRAALRIDSNCLTALMGLGRTYFIQAQWDSASYYFERACEAGDRSSTWIDGLVTARRLLVKLAWVRCLPPRSITQADLRGDNAASTDDWAMVGGVLVRGGGIVATRQSGNAGASLLGAALGSAIEGIGSVTRREASNWQAVARAEAGSQWDEAVSEAMKGLPLAVRAYGMDSAHVGERLRVICEAANRLSAGHQPVNPAFCEGYRVWRESIR